MKGTHQDMNLQDSSGWLVMLRSYMPQVSARQLEIYQVAGKGGAISNASDRNTRPAELITQVHFDRQ